MIEYVDCPFVIKMRRNKSDGSFTITKAQTEHRGHEVSQMQFKKYSKKRLGAGVQRNTVMRRQDKNENEQNEEQILVDSPSKEQGWETGGVSVHPE